MTRFLRCSLSFAAVLGVLTFAALLLMARAADPGTSAIDLSALDLSGLQGSMPDGHLRPILPPDGGFVLIASETCPHCHDSLRLIARAAAGRPLPHIHLVVLEGPDAASRIIRDTGGPKVVALAPLDSEALLSTLHITSVPLLLEVTRDGRIVAAEVGRLSPERAADLIDFPS